MAALGAIIIPIGIYYSYRMQKTRKFLALLGIVIGVGIGINLLIAYPYGTLIEVVLLIVVLARSLDKWKKEYNNSIESSHLT